MFWIAARRIIETSTAVLNAVKYFLLFFYGAKLKFQLHSKLNKWEFQAIYLGDKQQQQVSVVTFYEFMQYQINVLLCVRFHVLSCNFFLNFLYYLSDGDFASAFKVSFLQKNYNFHISHVTWICYNHLYYNQVIKPKHLGIKDKKYFLAYKLCAICDYLSLNTCLMVVFLS